MALFESKFDFNSLSDDSDRAIYDLISTSGLSYNEHGS